jgi:hypothetical protein
VSWFEASAYAAFAGKSLPIWQQWYAAAPSGCGTLRRAASNITTNALAPVGAYKGVGPYGTYDMAGNVREWVANADDSGHRFILGGSWKVSSVSLLSARKRSRPSIVQAKNGFRCVKNTSPAAGAAVAPIKRVEARDFAKYKPVSDDVFHAYQVLYAYPNMPMHETDGGVVKETADWREEKVTIDTGYRGERMSIYLFLPKNVRPPYQTVLFFPSARCGLYLRQARMERRSATLRFFDYIVQSGRAVVYPIYQDTYERRAQFTSLGFAE